jgi:hypothetical protein
MYQKMKSMPNNGLWTKWKLLFPSMMYFRK